MLNKQINIGFSEYWANVCGGITSSGRGRRGRRRLHLLLFSCTGLFVRDSCVVDQAHRGGENGGGLRYYPSLRAVPFRSSSQSREGCATSKGVIFIFPSHQSRASSRQHSVFTIIALAGSTPNAANLFTVKVWHMSTFGWLEWSRRHEETSPRTASPLQAGGFRALQITTSSLSADI